MADIYVNRELSWLKFNLRVLEEAEDESVPLFERLRFAAIFASNLDEFFMIRVGSLYDQTLLREVTRDNKSNLTPAEQLKLIFAKTRQFIPRRDQVYHDIMKGLSSKGVTHSPIHKLSGEDKHFLERYFEREILPLISPQIIDKHHPFPFLKNKDIYVGAHLSGKGSFVRFGVIPAGGYFDRVIFLPSQDGTIRFVLAEELICHFAGRIFEKYEIIDKTIFRITRNADISAEEALYDYDMDFRQTMEELMKKRKKLAAVRLELSSEVNDALKQHLCDSFEMSQSQIFVSSSPLDMSFTGVIESRLQGRSELFFEPLSPQHTIMVSENESMISAVKRQDILLSYPFESIAPFIRLLDEAATDPAVVSIKITLYRVAKDSQIINALIKAAENGKDVLAVVELRARFDEENNIDWSKRLEESGCFVIYGLGEYKVHSKLCLITRKTGNGIEYITQIGTGNYNEKTARLYTDLCLMTAHQEIGIDASMTFNSLSLGNPVEYARHLLVAPLILKQRVVEFIDREIAYARKGEPSGITCKINSLSDKTIIDKLIEASKAGVPVTLILRGICCLRSGIPEFTHNIKVISIVGRFLEHSRIYIFGAGERTSIFISSADFMTRNMQRRVEVAAPIYDPHIKLRILELINTMLCDNVKARVQQDNGEYTRLNTAGERIDSQLFLYNKAYENRRLYKPPVTVREKKNWFKSLFRGNKS